MTQVSITYDDAEWQVVPKRPDQAMCQAGQDRARQWPSFPLRIVPIFQDMLAAAPSAPQSVEDLEKVKAIADAERYRNVAREFGKIIQDLTVAMQSAVIEWQHGAGAEAGLGWIENTLSGPGHYPDFDAEHGKNAQFWYDTQCSDPMPKCFCGNPSHMADMYGAFCCDEHADEAKAKANAARAGETKS